MFRDWANIVASMISTMITVHYAETNYLTTYFPIPPAPPVTIAVFPLSDFLFPEFFFPWVHFFNTERDRRILMVK